jgi:dTDP-4-amino-4,6-dideoxygalactose transaminase
VIPLVDLKAQYRLIKPEIDGAIQRVIDNTSFILGKEVQAFEEAFAAYCGARYAVGVASGTAALHLALLACDVGSGDEVITSPHTFIATVEPICHVGARPVFVDIDPHSYNIDPAKFEAAITPRTKAIMPIHLYGQPADMDPLVDIARRHDLKVIEDAAQAHGAEYHGKRTGTLGDVACFSFYPGKNLGAYGDGGMVVTDDPQIADQARLLRNHGRQSKYEHQNVGYGERLDALQAAILGAKLAHLDEWTEQRRQAAASYCHLLAGHAVVQVPQEMDGVRHVYHLFVVRVPDRDAVLKQLKEAAIGAGIHYPIPLHLQPALEWMGHHEGDFPHTEQAAREILSLPLYPEIGEEQIAQVVQALTVAVGREK